MQELVAMQELIVKIQARAHDPETATELGTESRHLDGTPAYVAHPPLSEADMAQRERELGFALPPLLRTLYLQVGDGGFGPGYGLYRLSRCHPCAGPEELTDENSHYLEICEWGCAISSFIDCGKPEAPVFRSDPNQSETDVRPGRTFYMHAEYGVIYPEYASLEGWLEAWVQGKELFFSTYGIDPTEIEEADRFEEDES